MPVHCFELFLNGGFQFIILNLTVLVLLLFVSSVAVLHATEGQDAHALSMDQGSGMGNLISLDAGGPSTMSHITSSGGHPLSNITVLPGDGSITLTWDQYDVINNHNIVVKDSLDRVILNKDIDALGITIPDLINGEEYDITIKSYTTFDRIVYKHLRATTHISAVPGVPYPPTNLSASMTDDNTFVVTWKSPTEDNDSSLTMYTLKLTATDREGTNVPTAEATHNISSDTTTFTQNTTSDGWTYYITLTASNSVGESSHVDVLIVTPGPPGAVSDLRAEPQDQQITLTWSPPSINDPPVSEYVILSRIGHVNPFVEIERVSASTTSFVAANLMNGSEYQFTVYAINTIGQGPPYSSVVTATPDAVPLAPRNLEASLFLAIADFTWDAPDAPPGAPITSYVIRYTSSGGSGHYIHDSTDTTFKVDLKGNTSYTFTVHAVNRIGEGPASNSYSLTTRGF